MFLLGIPLLQMSLLVQHVCIMCVVGILLSTACQITSKWCRLPVIVQVVLIALLTDQHYVHVDGGSRVLSARFAVGQGKKASHCCLVTNNTLSTSYFCGFYQQCCSVYVCTALQARLAFMLTVGVWLYTRCFDVWCLQAVRCKILVMTLQNPQLPTFHGSSLGMV